MKLFVGTSGYSYSGWKGSFYPERLPAAEMLGFYAQQLPAVEINNTFYRLPKASVLETWAKQVPARFRFAIKASRRITHIKRLKNAADETAYLLETLEALGKRLGVVLFQLPPNLRKDLDRLDAFLDLLPKGTRAAFEFRHPSWLEDDVVERLRSRGVVMCLSEIEGADDPATIELPLASSASWGYWRLRRPDYGERDLERWVTRLRERAWSEAYVFFKHEEAGAGPKLAARFIELASQ